MNFSLIGNVTTDVHQVYRINANEVVRVLTAALGPRQYPPLSMLCVSPIVMASGAEARKESRRYLKKDGTLEASLRLDHARFKAGDDQLRRQLLFTLFFPCIEHARRALPAATESLDRLEKDLRQVGEQKGWLLPDQPPAPSLEEPAAGTIAAASGAAVPLHIRIAYLPRSPTACIGTHGNAGSRGQFLGCVVATLPEGPLTGDPTQKRWYAVLHRFDAAGKHLGTDHAFTGTSIDEPAAVQRADEKLRAFVERLEHRELRDIDIDLFQVTIDGHRFGLVDASDPDEGRQVLELVPNDLAFSPPWDGQYDT